MDNKPSSIIDTPISGSHDDLLKVSTYVNALETFLTKADTPLTVAIQGEWGSGKTSFMNQIHEGLCGSQGPFIGIWTHAWEYALLSEPNEILMNMVQGIIRDIEREAKTFGNSLPMSEAFHMARSMFVQVAKMGVQAAAVQAGVPASTSAGLLWNDDKGSSIGLLNESLDKAVHHCLELAEKKGKKGFIFSLMIWIVSSL